MVVLTYVLTYEYKYVFKNICIIELYSEIIKLKNN